MKLDKGAWAVIPPCIKAITFYLDYEDCYGDYSPPIPLVEDLSLNIKDPSYIEGKDYKRLVNDLFGGQLADHRPQKAGTYKRAKDN